MIDQSGFQNQDDENEEPGQVLNGNIPWPVDEPSEESVKTFASLYRGNTEAYGEIQGLSVKKPVTLDSYRQHLKGKRSLGIYPLIGDRCCFFTIDVDTQDFEKAKHIREYFLRHDLPLYISKSKSKGYHLDGFAWEKEGFKAAEIRKVVQYLLDQIGYSDVEIFPKQDKTSTECSLGNYINLPCFGSERPFVEVERGQPISLSIALRQIKFIQQKTVSKILAQIPEKVKRNQDTKKRTRGSPPCIETILRGVEEGRRDLAGFALARFYLKEGYSEDEVLERLCNWDARNSPPCREEELLKLVKQSEKGYRFGCKTIIEEPKLTCFCVGEDNCEWLKAVKTKKAGSNQAKTLVELVIQEGVELFRNQYGDPWVRININQHLENLNLNSKDFRHYLGGLLYQREEKAANPEVVRSVVLTLSGKAFYESKEIHSLNNRVASYEGAIYYDLSDERWRAIRVTQDGWEIIEKPPILFRRYKMQIPQVEPMKGGDPLLLLNLVRVRAEDRLLLLVYAISCLIPDIPHPILWVQGPEGSAKSALCRTLVIIIDPSSPALLAMQTQQREMVQQLDHVWLAVFDNVQGLADWQSDSLCRAVTGDGFTKRELFSDDDDVIYGFRRCVALNAINLESDRPDLLSRTLVIRLESIPDDQRKTEEELRQALEQYRASIVGGFLDVLSKAMSIRPQIKLATRPRMADFAVWGCAIAQALGHDQKEFIDAYNANMKGLRGTILSDDVVATVLLSFLQSNQPFAGTALELLEKLTQEAEINMKLDTKAKGWPKAPNALSRRLNILRANLEKEGVLIETVKNIGKDKIKQLRITKREVDDDDNDASKQKTSTLSTPSASEAEKRDDGGDDVEERDDDDRRCLASEADRDDTSSDLEPNDDDDAAKDVGNINF